MISDLYPNLCEELPLRTTRDLRDPAAAIWATLLLANESSPLIYFGFPLFLPELLHRLLLLEHMNFLT